VSAEYRGHGIGTRLVETAIERARHWGADGMYISATRTAPTVDFYLARGAILAVPADAERLAQEPVDVHLVLWWRPPT
jgi:GNAT superfamily N-acetyltransferase